MGMMKPHPAWDVISTTAKTHYLACGCSLSYIQRLLTRSISPLRYVLVHLHKKDALFVREDLADRLIRSTDHPDEFECYQGSLVEAAVNAKRIRWWMYHGSVGEILADMRKAILEDLTRRFG